MSRFMIPWVVLVTSLMLISCTESSENGDQSLNDTTSEQVSPEVDPAPIATDGPESMRSEQWPYVVNNAIRAADDYAVDRNPNATFVGPNVETNFIRQRGGEFEGRYLLMVRNSHGGNTSFVMLLPLFDENAPSDDLDDDGQLWRVVEAKFNGRDM